MSPNMDAGDELMGRALPYPRGVFRMPRARPRSVSGSGIPYPLMLLLGLYVMILPFEELISLDTATGPATLSRYIGMTVVFAFLSYLLVSKSALRMTKGSVWLSLYVSFACLSFGWTIVPDTTLARIPTVLSLLALYLVVGNFKLNGRGTESLISMICLGGFAASTYSIYLFHFRNETYFDSLRASIMLGEAGIDPNQFVFSLLLPLSLLLLKVSQGRNRLRRAIPWGAAMVVLYAQLITMSRSGFLAVAVVMSLFVLRRDTKGARFAAVTVLLMGALLAAYGPQIFAERMSFANQTFEYARGSIWAIGLRAFSEHWLLGGGLDSFPTLFRQYSPRRISMIGSHSIYVGTLAELGIVGFALLMTALLVHARGLMSLLKRKLDPAFAVEVAFLGMLLQGAFLDTLYRKPLWLVLMLITMLQGARMSEERPGPTRHVDK